MTTERDSIRHEISHRDDRELHMFAMPEAGRQFAASCAVELAIRKNKVNEFAHAILETLPEHQKKTTNDLICAVLIMPWEQVRAAVVKVFGEEIDWS